MILARKLCFLMIFFSLVLFSLFHRVPAQAVERIVISPARPQVGQPVTFRAVNWFDTPCVLWLFGDGAQDEDAVDPFTTTHRYEEPGTYTVKAHYDCDPVSEHVTTTITVSEPETTPSFGPAADFKISAVQLRFKEGRPYVEIPKNTSDFRAYADIKYEGTGTLRLQWLVDGKPIHFQTKVLSFARQTVIDSGRGLPTTVTGPHDVSLRFLEPEADFEIPVIRYFVKVDESDVQTATDIGLSIKGVMDAEGGMLPLLNNTIRAEANTPVILDGRIENRQPWVVAQGILNIYAGEKLVDRQLVRNLKPGEERDFQVSMLSPGQGERLVRIELTDKAGAVLQTSLLNLQPLDVPEIKPQPMLISGRPDKTFSEVPEPPTLPKGVIAKFKLRPRHVFAFGGAGTTTDTVYVDYHIENFMWGIITHYWYDLTYGSTAFYDEVLIKDQKGTNLLTIDHNDGYYYKETLSFKPKGVPSCVVFRGFYYDPRSKEKFHKDKISKYIWYEWIQSHHAMNLPAVYLDDWKAIDSKYVEQTDDMIKVYFDPLSLRPEITYLAVDIGVTVGNSKEVDAGEVQVGVDSLLPHNWSCINGVLPYVSGESKGRTTFTLRIPKDKRPPNGQMYCRNLTGKVDLEETYLKPAKHAKDFHFKVCLVANKPPQKRASSGPGSISGYDPMIREFEAVDRAILKGETAVISYDVENVTEGSIHKIDVDQGRWKDLGKITTFKVEAPKRTGLFRGIVKDRPTARTVYQLQVAGPEEQGKKKRFLVQTIVNVHDKKDFTSEPIIRSFSVKPKKISAGKTCTLAYALSPVSYAVIFDLKSGTREILNTAGPGNPVTGSVQLKPKQSTIYELRCGNTLGEASQTVEVEVVGSGFVKLVKHEPDIVQFKARTLNLDWNQKGKLDVKIDNVKKAVINNADTGQKILELTPSNGRYRDTVFVSPRRNTTYRLEASNDKGQSSAIASIFMPKKPPVIYDFDIVNPRSLILKHGQSVKLKYNYLNAEKVFIMDWDRQKRITELSSNDGRGSITLTPDAGITYGLQVSNPLGKDVRVAPRLKVTFDKSNYDNKKPLIYLFEANTKKAANGDQISLTYRFTGAESAVIFSKNDPKDLDMLPVGKPGKVVKGELKEMMNKTTTFILECKNPFGVVRKEVQIRVE